MEFLWMGDPSINGENDTGAKYSSFNGGNGKSGKLLNIFNFSGFPNYIYLKCTCFDLLIQCNWLTLIYSPNVGSVLSESILYRKEAPLMHKNWWGEGMMVVKNDGVLLVLVKNSVGQGGNIGTLHNAVCHSHTSGKTTWDAVNVRFLP